MKINLNLEDRTRIRSKLTKLQGQQGNLLDGVRLQWRLVVLNNYKKVVQEAMGSVSAHSGGYMRMSFLTATGKEYWKHLHPKTLKKKEELKSPYMFRIWADTGDTRDSVTVQQGLQGESFAGITSAQGWEFEKARGNEFGEIKKPSGDDEGGIIPPRRLFTVANVMFRQALKDALANPNSDMAILLRRELIDKVFIDKQYWGYW